MKELQNKDLGEYLPATKCQCEGDDKETETWKRSNFANYLKKFNAHDACGTRLQELYCRCEKESLLYGGRIHPRQVHEGST